MRTRPKWIMEWGVRDPITGALVLYRIVGGRVVNNA